MNTVVFLLFAIVSVTIAIPSEKYTTKYDNLDVNEIVKSDRLMMIYLDCLLERGSCTPDGLELKKVLGDALETDCSKCSDRQKDAAKIVIRHLLKNKREWWNDLEKKYDPQGTYLKKYEDTLKAEGIVV